MSNFTGRWITSFGPMELRQDSNGIHGTYWYQGVACRIVGNLQDGRFSFRYQDASGAGKGWFETPRYGQLRGQYCLDGTDRWGDWNGNREWDGIWDTPFGRVRLVQEPDRILGSYEGAGPARIEGRLQGNRFVFRYFEPKTQGDGWFELANDAASFAGAWRPDGATAWGDWPGRRVLPMPGLTWLVVIEAHWQRSLADGEYSYGEMLSEFFARLQNVAVRHRFFNDEPSLERWCRELTYVPEPAIVLISSHGLSEGVTVNGQTIDTKRVIASLSQGANLKLLHLAACLTLKDSDVAHRLGPVPYPISGYTTSIDWGGSAVLEFSYFDMILSKGLSPEDAAARLPKLVAYSGDHAPAESPYNAAGFRFIPASRVP
jgi:hypothetical protein